MTEQHREVDEIIEEIVEDIIELEEYAKAGKPVHKGKKYRIRVDKERFVLHHHEVTGREILALVHKTPDKYHLYQHVHHGQTKPIQADEVVDLTAKGVERFTTMKIENTEGREVTR
jgi:hypothetical protein